MGATWSGGGANANWSTSGNWDALPVDGDPLTFAGTTRQTNSNDLLTSVGAVTFSSAGWNITGNAVTLGGNMALNANGTTTWGLDTTFSATRNLTADNGRTLVLSGVLSGAGGLNGGAGYSYDGTIRLSGTANTFDGQVNAASTRLEVTKLADGGQPSSVGDGSSEIIVGSAITGAPGILSYIGTTDSSTNRRPRLFNWGSYGAVLRNDSPNNSNLSFTSATDWYLGWRDNDATLRLQGTSTGTSLIAGNLSDSDYTGGKKNSVLVSASGAWVLSGSSTYTGNTTVTAGRLGIGAAAAGTPASITSGPIGRGTLDLNGGAVSSNGATARDIINPVSVTANSTLGNGTDNGVLTVKSVMTLNGAINSQRQITVDSPVALEGGVVSGAAGAGLAKAGSSTLTLSSTGNWTGATSVSAGTFLVSSGGSIPQAGNLSVSGGVFRINTPGGAVVSPTTSVTGGSLSLEAGTFRTNNLGGAALFSWTGGTLTNYDAPTLGIGPDASAPGGAVVQLGRTISVTGDLATGAGTILDLGDLYLRGATVFNQLVVSGSLTVGAGTELLSVASPYLLRGSTGGDPVDYGTLVLVEASGGITNPGNFVFQEPASDGRPFAEYTGPVPFAGNPANLPDNTWYLEATATQILFHYKVSAAIPEPGTAGLMVCAALLLRAFRTRRMR